MGCEEAWGRRRELGVFDGGAVASHEDGVHDGEGATDSEDEAEEDTDERAGEEVHDDPWYALEWVGGWRDGRGSCWVARDLAWRRRAVERGAGLRELAAC